MFKMQVLVIALDCWYFWLRICVPHEQVRVVSGETYMLTQDEELWEKQLPPLLVFLLKTKDPRCDRGDYSLPVEEAPQGCTRGVTYRVPHNAASQIYDYTEKKAR